MAAVQQSVRDGRNDNGVAEEFVAYSIDWLRRLLLRDRLWSGVWLPPEPWPRPKPNMEVPHQPPS